MTSSLPAVAVVIPLHNGGPWIRATLASVKAQTHAPAEIVVVDDRSTDDGAKQAASVPGVTVRPLLRPSVKGGGPGRQCGFEHATAPLVAFLDQDDLWHPDHLRLLATVLAERPSCPAAVGGIDFFGDGTGPTYDPPRLAPLPADPWASFPFYSLYSPSGVLVRRTALESIGGWPTDGPVTDFLAWFRLSIDEPFVENRCITCSKRIHSASKTLDIQTNSRATYLQYRASLLRPLISERARRHPEQALRLHARIDALHAGGLLAAAYDSATPALIATAAPALEALAATEPGILDRLFSFLFGFVLSPAMHESVDSQSAFLEFFLSSWPASAPQAGTHLESLFVRSLSPRAFLRFLGRHPRQLQRWRLGLASARRALNRLRARVRA